MPGRPVFGGPRVFHRWKSPNRLMPREDKPADLSALMQAVAYRADREAFAALFDFYAPRIKGMLMRGGTAPALAEDLAQDTLLAVWRKAAQFDPGRAGLSTWIFTIARNLRIDHARRGRGASAEAIYEVLAGTEPEQPDEALDSVEREDCVRRAMQALNSDQAAVVKLSFFEDKPHAEIATILGLPLGTVKSRLRVAMIKLRERIEDLT